MAVKRLGTLTQGVDRAQSPTIVSLGHFRGSRSSQLLDWHETNKTAYEKYTDQQLSSL